jgi:hypothetical protein
MPKNRNKSALCSAELKLDKTLPFMFFFFTSYIFDMPT